MCCLAVAGIARAQVGIGFHVNPGQNGQQDVALGEFATDLGGFIPFSTYDDAAHYWVNQLGAGPLRQLMLDSVTNLPELDQELVARTGVSIFPPDIQFEGDQDQAAWWNADPAYLHVWKFRINGGPVLIVRRNGVTPDPVHLLMYNTGAHDSDFGTTKQSVGPFNDLDFADGFTQVSWPWPFDPSGQPNLRPVEQAVERGDLVIQVKENVGQDFWTALQRTQDAEHFVRHEFQSTYLAAPLSLGNSYLDGASWGGQVSLMFALLQPAVYSGAVATFGHDVGFHLPGVGDWDRLNGHRRAGTGLLEPSRVHSDRRTKDFFLLVDILGTRFDDPDTAFGMQPWDLAAFSVNHRLPSELNMTVRSIVADEELFIHPDWQRRDGDTRPNLDVQYVRNYEHGGVDGVAPGFNEYFPFTGNEWQEMLVASSAPTASNVELVPARTPDAGDTAYPDPYTHTLRHVPRQRSYGPMMLDVLKLNTESKGPEPIGQGVWPGNHDSMLAGDVDGDGNIEVVFGNFDGYLHVLELDLSSGAARLIDEWRSDNLGWGIWASTPGPIDDGRRMVFGDNVGQLHALQAVGTDQYALTGHPQLSSQQTRDRMGGQVATVYQGEFSNLNGGAELLALNQWLDWVLLTEDGTELDLLKRGPAAVGPGIATATDVDEDGQQELLVPALDGGLWCLRDDGAGLRLDPLLSTDRALYRVENAGLGDTSPCPNYVIMMGRNDDLPVGAENVYMLVRMDPTPAVVAELTAFSNLERPNFAWMHDASQNNRSFFCGSRSTIERVRVDGLGLTCECSAEMPTLFLIDGVEVGEDICAIEYVPTGTNTGYVFVATGNGRIFVLDENLNFLYDATDEWAGDPDAPATFIPFPWYSNRTVGHVFGVDLHQRPFDGAPDAGEASLYWAEYMQPMWRRGAVRNYRVGRLGGLDGGPFEWDPLASFTAPTVAERRNLTRTFLYQDLVPDPANQPEPYFLSEAGVAMWDGTRVRQFSNRCLDFSIFPGAIGGSVYEFFNVVNYSVLDGFSIPRDGNTFDSGRPTDWWYAKIGARRIGGQIANHSQAVTSLYDGTSMALAQLTDPLDSGSPAVPHVVTGTYGGYVYAIRPGAASVGDSLPSTLSYVSDDLGSRAIGMDTGDLDGDGVDEVVVGTWLDTGSYEDWRAGLQSKNRGHLMVLKATAPTVSGQPGKLAVSADFTCDDDLDPSWPRTITSGVFGIKIDDVNGDGTPEIWAGDAVGRIYLYRQTGGEWDDFFISEEIGAYAGMYNGLFPVKDAQGRTVRLIVQTSGYVYAFDVNHGRLPAAGGS